MSMKSRVKTRILLADDHSLLREAMRNAIDNEEDMEVVGEAGDGEEAVKMSSELKPDIVIMDIVMPKLDGIKASKQIKSANPGIAVLILTAYDDDRYVLGLLEAGAAGYLLKSARSRDVVGAIRSIRMGDAVLHPSVMTKLLKRAIQGEVSPPEQKRGEVLSTREIEVMKLAATGMSNKDIAEQLCLTVRTVKAHLSNAFTKLNVASRTEATLKGLKEGWLTLEEAHEEANDG